MKVDFVEFLEAVDSKYKTLVVIGERTHYIFNDGDEVSVGWASLFVVTEVISENYESIIIRIEYIDEE